MGLGGTKRKCVTLALPPQNDIPVMLRDKSIGMVIFRHSQLAQLSPVQIAPVGVNNNKQLQRENGNGLTADYTQV